MCYNCGCKMADQDNGKGSVGVDPNGASITNKTFEAVGKAYGMSAKEAKENTLQLLKEELE